MSKRVDDGLVNPHGLEHHGIRPAATVHWNAPVPVLVEHALRRGEAQLTSLGALCARTGPRTGRSPKDKFIVRDVLTESTVDWGAVNVAIAPDVFDRLHARVAEHLARHELFVLDAWTGADPHFRMPIRVVSELAWHSLFARQLFRRATPDEQARNVPQFTVLAAPGCDADPKADGVNSNAFICVSFAKRLVLIGGTYYAGEIKKSIFTILNHLLPERDVFPMHCSANVGADGDVALFFGLSGTGKTTLSADAERRLIGDDEHGWSRNGIFNFEGGCYAKCIRLSPRHEPQIHAALRFGSVLENVVLDPATRRPDFDDGSITENTRAAYPIDFIANAVPEGYVHAHPNAIIFLTCDAFGVLPPVSRLSTEQAMYHFLSGYTAKLAGTEAGVGSEPEATFSTCFGAPFLPRSPLEYARMLAERVEAHRTRCYLINTGWSGGPFGVGSRVRIDHTRAMVRAALSGALDELPAAPDPIFRVLVPKSCPGVSAEILQPRGTWSDRDAYDAKARELAGRFSANFKKFPGAPKEVQAAGPQAG
ncbi:MAG: phosphoenolpyruvate carboxykinase (ATP) [Phycisphaerae bacterium]|nr:phosphoenolpyruvate carboxykinase (ATP) [Phycisphaerae bacterium]